MRITRIMQQKNSNTEDMPMTENKSSTARLREGKLFTETTGFMMHCVAQ
jgi:hypothetical protein